jgi:hypothetical protein
MTFDLPKRCGCGLVHDAPAWEALARLGVQRGREEDLELRNCACGSTLAISVVVGTKTERRCA